MRQGESPAEKGLFDGDARRRGENARLAHAPAHGLAQVTRALDERATADEDAADGCAEAFGETQGYAIALGGVAGEFGDEGGTLVRGGEVGLGDGGGDRFPETSAIAVQMHGMRATPGGDAGDFRQGHHRAGERVFETDESGRGAVDLVAEDGVFLHVFQREVVPIAGSHGPYEGMGEPACAAGFPAADVAAAVDNDAIRRGAIKTGAQGELVPLCTAGDEQGILVLAELRSEVLQIVRGGILKKHVVQQGGSRDAL